MKDRFTILVCLVVALVGVAGSAAMFPAINQQRRELQLSADLERGDNVPPDVALTAAALGSFKGMAVNYMWYRIEMLKREGKFFEANSLANWITTLQPRFPQVWSFHAWNMAYNISVETHTPEERYAWVMKGVDLLRQKGIPLNPNAVRLYRELGWIYFHKLGQYADDMHWYYKRREARHWQELLGTPSEGMTAVQAADRFAPIAEASERYFQFRRMPAEARRRLIDLAIALEAEGQRDQAQRLRDISILPLSRSAEALRSYLNELEARDPQLADRVATLPDTRALFRALAAELASEDRPDAAAAVREIAGELPETQAQQMFFALRGMAGRDLLSGDNDDLEWRIRRLFGSGPFSMPPLERTELQIDRQLADALSMLYADAPEARPVVERLRELGFGLDEETLATIGKLVMLYQYRPVPTVLQFVEQTEDEATLEVARMLTTSEYFNGFAAVMAFLRAKVLLENYYMDPAVMHDLMTGQALRGPDNPDTITDESVPTPMPLDWRHPATHALYWSHMGVVKAGELNNDGRIDYINTYRQIIHGIQSLSRFGRVSYDPITERVDLLPDPRFFDAYEKAALNAKHFTEQAEIDHTQGTIDSYESGHENLLAKAVVVTYLYGNRDNAQDFYDRVRVLYGDKPHNFRTGRYTFPLDDFVQFELMADGGMQAVSRAYIDGMITQAIMLGLRLGRPDVFANFIRVAQRAHEQFQAARNKRDDPNAVQDRMRFLEFPEMFREGYAGIMRNPNIAVLERQRIYANTPTPIREEVYPRFHRTINDEGAEQGFNAAAMFPPPPNFDETQIELTPEESEAGDTLQRN
ncbi:MAG: hypothetical protein AAF586_10605 [Planctomycetota bacterium]